MTDLAVLGFHPGSHRMRLRSVHPGASADEVVAVTGFELLIDEESTETEPPSAEELELLNRLDPTGMRAAAEGVGQPWG